MSYQSKIEWTDSTFNPWEGCTKVGPGCDHCYAEARNNRFQGGNWGPGAPRRRTSEKYWRLPQKWNDRPLFQCPECGWRGIEKESGMWMADDGESPSCPRCEDKAIIALQPARRRVFCASLADWLDNEAPIDWLMDLLDLIRRTPNLDWLLLTKRIGNWQKRLEYAHTHAYHGTDDGNGETFDLVDAWLNAKPPANVWLGATIVNQEEADRDIPKLLQVPARIRFLSMEPLLGEVRIPRPLLGRGDHGLRDIDPLAASMLATAEEEGAAWVSQGVDWVIAGGESGPHARPMHPDWVRSLRNQCQNAGVPFLFKQWGEWASPGYEPNPPIQDAHLWPYENDGNVGPISYLVGKRRAGRRLDDRTWDQFPEGA